MKWKVCGMREPQNIWSVLEQQPDYMGFIFYPKSERYVRSIPPRIIDRISDSPTRSVGVFVNAIFDDIMEKVSACRLSYVQLHGDEPVSLAEKLADEVVQVIKVFRVNDRLPAEAIKAWEHAASLFLFDTAAATYGGSGRKFSWDILKAYDSRKPFMLSGGVDTTDLSDIKSLNIPRLMGIDVNSRMELSAGIKDIEKIKQLKKELCRAQAPNTM